VWTASDYVYIIASLGQSFTVFVLRVTDGTSAVKFESELNLVRMRCR
jgi:hypothetical protein